MAERSTRTTTAIRFPPEMHRELHEASEAHGVSINYLVTKAVEGFLADLLDPSEVRWTSQANQEGT